MKQKKLTKIFIVLLLVISLTGCTKILKGEDKKAITNTETGQSVTENILCRPTDKNLLKIYEDNKKDLSNIPECKDMPVWGEYESLWTNLFVKPLAYIIIQLGQLLNTTGGAIILVTLAIRLILYPVTRKTAMQSESIKQAQPELSKLEKKYENKTDTQSQNQKAQEMLIIYKKYNINPLSGCLFAIIQIPLLFAFLEAINRVPAIFEETFIGLQMGTTPWVGITTGHWYYIIFVILIIATTFYSFKMNQTTASPDMQQQNKMMMIFMTVFIGITSFTLPTAIAVYWVVSSLFTILQNAIMIKVARRRK